MSEFRKVMTLTDLESLDREDVVLGYLYGLDNESEPGSDKSRGFWHGWRNARADRTGKTDAEQQMLARQYVGKMH